MTIKNKYPDLSDSLKDFVFYLANGTLIFDKNNDYRHQVLAEGSFSNTVYSLCSKINLDEFKKGIFTSIGRGYEYAKESLKTKKSTFGKTGNFLDSFIDFSKKLSEGTLTGENQTRLQKEFEELLFDPANIEMIFHLYCRLAIIKGDHIANHDELCYKIGLLVDPESEIDYEDFEEHN